MIYGHNKTVHSTNLLNVEVDKDGNVVSVWFRCMPLAFDSRVVEDSRAKDMQKMYEEKSFPKILAIEVEDK